MDLPEAVEKAILVDNVFFGQVLLIILASVAVSTAIYNIVLYAVRYIRTLTCLNNDKQRYFKMAHPVIGRIKQHLLYAPLFRRRHSRQMRIGPLDAGTLPTRFQSLLLFGIVVMNITFAAYGLEWRGVPKDNPMPLQTLLMHLTNRTGVLAIVNMIPQVILAGRNNPLIGLLGLSFDTFNLLHRWFGRIVVALAVTHASMELYLLALSGEKTHIPGAQAIGNSLKEERFMLWGLVAVVPLVVIFLISFSAFRHAFYETFLHLHIALVGLVLAALWFHLDGNPPQAIVKIVISIWIVERLIRMCSLIYRSVGRGGTQAQVETLPGDALRVTLNLARPWNFKSGQHVFLTIPSVGLWTSHPFSVAWSEYADRFSDPEKGPITSDADILAHPQTSISLIIRRRSGFTDRLYKKVARSSTACVSIPALIEGPYGPSQTLSSYGTVMLFAGGVGITHAVPHVRSLVAGYANSTVAARRVLLVWIIQSPEHLEWIRPWMTTILAMHKRRDVLRIQLFVTRPRSTKEIHSPSATVQMFPGKPNVDTLVEMESRDQVGAMGISACGPGALGDDVRAAVRRRQDRNIDFIEESFGW